MAFAPGLRALAPLLRLLHGHRRGHRGGPVPALALARATAPSRARAGRSSASRTRASTTRAARWPSGPTACSTSGPGDGGGGGDPDRNAQNRGRLLGKILRIRPRPGGGYSVPRSNPFVGRAGARGEVFAYGLRNPYRFSFDRRTGALDRRRRGPGRGRGGRLRARPRQRRLQLRLERVRGAPPATTAGSAPGHRPPFVERTHDQGCVLDHRRLRGARPLAAAAARQVRVRRPLRPAPARGVRARRALPRRPRARACGCRTWSRSARTRAGGSTPSRWTARSTGSRPP